MARTGKVKKDGFFSNDYIKRSNPFIPLMTCECGQPTGGNCHKDADCKAGLRCAVSLTYVFYLAKLANNATRTKECDEGLSCAPSGECVDHGGIGSHVQPSTNEKTVHTA